MSEQKHRRRTYNIPGDAHELTFTCDRRFPFLKAERTCVWLAESINRARMIHEFDLWAFVFMPDHVHMIVFPRKPEARIQSILKSIKQPVSRRAMTYLEKHAPSWLDRLLRRRGAQLERSFWLPGGGYDRNVSEPKVLGYMIDYIHQNPVRKGLVARPSDWTWSSAGAFEGIPNPMLSVDPIPVEWLEDHSEGR